MVKKVTLRASEVAAIIGLNPYKTRAEMILEHWKRYSPKTFSGEKTQTDEAVEILSSFESARAVLREAVSARASDSTHVQEILSAAEYAINSDSLMAPDQKLAVIEHVRSRVSTTHGTRSEDATADKVVAKKLKSKLDFAENVIASSSAAKSALDDAMSTEVATSTGVAAVAVRVEEILDIAKLAIDADKNLTERDKKEVIEYIETKVCSHNDLPVVNRSNVRLVRDNSFYTHDVCRKGSTQFTICGKVDRIEENDDDGSRVLVEIKNRTNRLFGRVVEYEMVQVQVYLHMLNLNKARLVEQFNDQVESHDIDRDDVMWNDVILPGVEEFCAELYSKF